MTLDPAGSLVRGRQGALVLSVTRTVPAKPGGGADETTQSGPLTANLTLPAGVSMTTGDPGDGWKCGALPGGIRCTARPIAAGHSSEAYIPVYVGKDAAATPPTVVVTSSTLGSVSATSSGGAVNQGLAAVLVGRYPAAVKVVGNSLLSCGAGAADCATSQSGGGSLLDNNDHTMLPYRDPAAPDGAPADAAVSGASLPLNGTVIWAGLYWATTGIAPADPTAYLRVPGNSEYTEIKAARVDQIHGGSTPTNFAQDAYQATADVTDLVRGNAGGQWWLAVPTSSFISGLSGSFGGWSLVVVATDGGAPRHVTVYDGLTPLQGNREFRAPVDSRAGASTSVGLVAWEGDRDLTGDTMRIGDTPLKGTGDQGDNVAASRSDGTPPGWDTFGVDARVLSGTVPADQASRSLLARTVGDAWLLGALAVVTPQN